MCEFVVFAMDIKHVDLWRAMKVNKEEEKQKRALENERESNFPKSPFGEIGEILLYSNPRENLNVFFPYRSQNSSSRESA